MLQPRHLNRSIPRRWLRGLAVLAGVLVALKIAGQILIQIAPRTTPPALAFALHSRARLRLRDVAATLAPLDIRPGQRVLEVGAGTGTFTLPLAERVAPDGRIASIELQRAMLQWHVRRRGDAATDLVTLHQADAHALPFADDSFDRALMVAILPMVRDKQRALRELRRVLRPGGLLLVSEEWLEPEYVPLAVTRRWCERAGFEQVRGNRSAWFYTLVVRNPIQVTGGGPG